MMFDKLYESVMTPNVLLAEGLEEIVSIKVDMGEAGFSKMKGKTFKSAAEAEKEFNKIKKEKVGYDKVFLKIKLNDGKTYDVKYYHSEKDGDLTDQLKGMMK